jgi:folate-binding Fe-S cluster repair protein YgfZ
MFLKSEQKTLPKLAGNHKQASLCTPKGRYRKNGNFLVAGKWGYNTKEWVSPLFANYLYIAFPM